MWSIKQVEIKNAHRIELHDRNVPCIKVMLPTFAPGISPRCCAPAENSCVKVEALTPTSEAGSALGPLFLGGGTNFHRDINQHFWGIFCSSLLNQNNPKCEKWSNVQRRHVVVFRSVYKKKSCETLQGCCVNVPINIWSYKNVLANMATAKSL